MTAPAVRPADTDSQAGLWLLLLLLLGGVFLASCLLRGWFPHDEGALGQMAERVLSGQVPHRDFDEPYTGLLTYLNALAFGIGGVRLPVLRIPLFLMSMLWLAAVYAIARRSVGPRTAAAIGALALVWSVPNYPASMPSWYNLFFATFGILALYRWRESGGREWLFGAGMAGGISFLFKLSGLFYVAGVLLFLVHVTRGEEPASGETSTDSRLAPVAITAGLLIFVAMVWRSIAPYYEARPILHFVVPSGVLAGALISREWAGPAVDSSRRLRRLIGAGLPFLAGAAVPVILFAAGFWMAGGLGELLRGVFISPFKRLAFANMRPPAPYWALAAVPLGVMLRPRPAAGDARWRRLGVLVALLLLGVLWLSLSDSFPHRVVWQSLRSLTPILAVLGALIIAWPGLTREWAPGAAERTVLLVCVCVLSSLVQFPFSSPTYFLYVAPLCLLALVGLVGGSGKTPVPLTAVTLAFYGVFAVAEVIPGSVVGLGYRYERVHETVPLALPRGGLRVRPEDAALYESLIQRLQARAGRGEIWAGPDAPEVYFLGGYSNHTRAIFDFLGSDQGQSSGLLDQMQRPEVTAIVINHTPSFSRQLSPLVLEAVGNQFPSADTIGRFELRWRR